MEHQGQDERLIQVATRRDGRCLFRDSSFNFLESTLNLQGTKLSDTGFDQLQESGALLPLWLSPMSLSNYLVNRDEEASQEFMKLIEPLIIKHWKLSNLQLLEPFEP